VSGRPVAAPTRAEWGTLSVAGVLLALLTQLDVTVFPVSRGLDASYTYGYNYAADRGLEWGREFVSTYGPFGYLVAGMDVGDRPERRAVALVLRCVAVGLLAALHVLSAPGAGRAGRAALLLAVLAALALQQWEYVWLGPLLLLCRVAQDRDGRSGLLAAAAAGLVAGFFVLMKWSLGLPAVAAVLIACVTARTARPARLAALGVGAPAGFLAGWLAHGQPVGAIPAYVRTGLELVRGYSSAMSLAPVDSWIGIVAFGIWAAGTVTWIWARRSRRGLVALAAVAPLAFVAWKHGMVRQDGHAYFPALFGLFVITVLLVDTLERRHWRGDVLIAGALVVVLAYVPCNQFTGGRCGLTWLASTGSTLARLPGLTALRDLGSFGTDRANRTRVTESMLAPLRLSPALQSRLGDGGADVYPWETSYLVASGIAWRNRPVPGSFGAYTRRLDAMNARFFESDRRPSHLLWHTDTGTSSIDGRHVLWDEPATIRTLLAHYEVVAADDGMIVLGLRRTPRPGAATPVGTARAAWGAWIDVPRTRGVLLMRAALPPSWRVALIRAVFRDAAIFVGVRSEARDAAYRALPESLAQGIWLSPLPGTAAEMRALLASGTGPRVTAIRFDGNTMAGGRSVVHIEWLELAAGRAADGGVGS
jgi:hypothetical protein